MEQYNNKKKGNIILYKDRTSSPNLLAKVLVDLLQMPQCILHPLLES